MRYALTNKSEIEKQFGEKGYEKMAELLKSEKAKPFTGNARPDELFFYITSRKGARMIFKVLEQTYDVCKVEFLRMEK